MKIILLPAFSYSVLFLVFFGQCSDLDKEAFIKAK